MSSVTKVAEAPGAQFQPDGSAGRVSGPAAEHASYSSFVTFADPGNPLAVLVPLTAAAMDLIAVSAAVTGWVVRLPVAPRAARGAALDRRRGGP